MQSLKNGNAEYKVTRDKKCESILTLTKVLYFVSEVSHKIFVMKLPKCGIDEWMAR